jgi:hypothetical protein
MDANVAEPRSDVDEFLRGNARVTADLSPKKKFLAHACLAGLTGLFSAGRL